MCESENRMRGTGGGQRAGLNHCLLSNCYRTGWVWEEILGYKKETFFVTQKTHLKI